MASFVGITFIDAIALAVAFADNLHIPFIVLPVVTTVPISKKVVIAYTGLINKG